MSFSMDNQSGPIANINVTPLVDVMLVMLVIFMITAPIMQQGVEVNLPKATTAPLAGDSEQVVISINRAGQVFIGSGNQIESNSVGEKLVGILQNRPEGDRKVYIKADTDVPYGKIMEVMSSAHRSGITQIGLISDPTGSEDERKTPR